MLLSYQFFYYLPAVNIRKQKKITNREINYLFENNKTRESIDYCATKSGNSSIFDNAIT